MRTSVKTAGSIDARKLVAVLEPMVRRVVREELARVAAKKPGIFYLEPCSSLYEDMEQILRDAQAGQIKLLSRKEALRG